ncbi:hypothetical protein SCHPADRAFT_901950 [Schizopora paradoxa]|uniref:Uncharacterized protein n=1 Tax=Schizopora paradoxa TaxID=27342 RepID=A0A0H2SG18_9AGAM|nr:hypothetical protein SCHPADRAFT_901950 [Schizopora paradoxa]
MPYAKSMAALRLDSDLDFDDQSVISGSQTRSTSIDLSSERALLSRRRHSTTSIQTFTTASTSRTLAGLKTLRQVALGPLVFIPVLARVASAKRELATIRRKSLPSPLFELRKVVEELLQLSDDTIPRHIRKSALRILKRSFQEFIHDIFLPFGQEVYDCYKLALNELCSDTLTSTLRNEDFYGFYYMIAAGANLPFKDGDLEKEDCRMIATIARSTSLPSLKLAGYVYLRIAWNRHSKRDKNPIAEETLREAAESVFHMTWSMYPYAIRQSAIDQLWYFERAPGSNPSFITSADMRFVLTHIMDLAEDPEAPDSGLPALARVWWFTSLPAWSEELSKNSSYKHRVGEILLNFTGATCSDGVRRETYQLLYRLSNVPTWSDVLDLSTLQQISMTFAGFCLTEQQNDVNKRRAMVREIRKIVSEAVETTPHATREVVTITKRLDVEAVKSKGGLSNRIASWMCIDDQLKNWESQAPSIDTHAMIENLSVFVLPDESLLDKIKFAGVLERVSTYAQTISQTREIAVDALFVLLNVRDWLGNISLSFDGTVTSL